MNRAITNAISLTLDVYNILICLFILFSLCWTLLKNRSTIFLILLCVSTLIFNVADMSNWCCEGLDAAWKVPALHVLTFVFYAIVPFMYMFFIKYVEEYIEFDKKLFIYISIIVSSIYLIGVFLSIILPDGFYYYITEDNFYARGKYNIVCAVFYLLFYIESVLIVFVKHTKMNVKVKVTLLSFTILPLLTELIQNFCYGLSLVNTGITLSLLLVFMNIHKSLENTLKETTTLVKKQEKHLFNLEEHMINSLSNLVENRDTETGEHAKRTSIYVKLLATKCMEDGYYKNTINERYIHLLVKAAPMHDIGKIVTSDIILKKTSRLTAQEFEIMKEHAKEGGKIVKNIVGISNDKEYIKIAVDVAQSHHEWWNGNGYPNKLKGEEIPLSARIMAIADVFDALISVRCYKNPFSPEKAFGIIEQEAGTHFDPILVKEFLSIKSDILNVIEEIGNE